mgnify:CR=1 FL=1
MLVDRSVTRYLQSTKIADQPTFDEGEIGSQVYVLSSDSVIVPVVRALGLAHDREFVGLPKMGGARLSDYFGDLKRFFLNSVGANAGEPENPEAALERAAAEAIVKRLTVTREDVANVINVAFESSDKFKAARIANAIAETAAPSQNSQPCSPPSGLTTSTMGRLNWVANAKSRSSCAGTAMIAPVPYAPRT